MYATGIYNGQKRVSDTLGLELQMVASDRNWVLGPELQSFGGTVSGLNQRANPLIHSSCIYPHIYCSFSCSFGL